MTMNDTFKELFGSIQAEKALKDHTQAFLAQRTRGYTKEGRRIRRYPAYAAACICLLLVMLGGRWLYFIPTAEISIDINPSIELSVNRFDRIIAITGLNEDGKELSKVLDVKYKDYAQAIEQILHHDSITALLSGGEVMSITVVGPDEQQSAKLLSGIRTCTAGQSNIDCYFAQSEEAAAAHEAGLSCGKYRAFLELQLLDPDITPEAVQGMTMREIRELIESLRTDGEDGTSPYNDWGGGHHGQGDGHGNRWRNGKTGSAYGGDD